MRDAIVWASSAVFLSCAAAANAAPPQLKGRYAVTGTSDCIVARGTNRFNSKQQVIGTASSDPVAPFHRKSSNIFSTRTYNGDGTGSAEGRLVTITTPLAYGGAITPNASSSSFTFKFTYGIDANGLFTTHSVPGTYLGTILTGQRAGQTYTVSSVEFSGLVSGDKKIIDVANVAPEVQAHTYFDGGNVVDGDERICSSSRVHAFLGE